ncbi:uncharacterized protein V6R79_008243 [Siganus canaliculatus]
MKAGQDEQNQAEENQVKENQVKEKQEKERRRLPKLKNPKKIWKNRKHNKNSHTTEEVLDLEEVQEEQLEEVSRRLITREEQLFRQDPPSEEDEDQLLKDLEALRLQIWMAVNSSFSCSSSVQQEVLRSAVASIQQQEAQDQRWRCSEERVPEWRPQKFLSAHHSLLHNIVDSRLTQALKEDLSAAGGLSSPTKQQVCCLGRRVKEDLLAVERGVKDCYPPHMDILNLYAGLYHQGFSAHLNHLAASGPGPEDCTYLLFWNNYCYPQEILKHGDLDGKIKTACLGSLLQLDHLNKLEDQYLIHKQDQVKLWLNNMLKTEEEAWLKGGAPEILDQYRFSPLAVDCIQVMDNSLTEFRSVIRDERKAQSITAHLESFLGSYRKSLEEFVKGDHSNGGPVVKAQLFCEQQLRDYITGQTGSLSQQQQRCCLDALDALRECGYKTLTASIQTDLKVSLRHLWTPGWLDGSLPVVQSLLDSLQQHLPHLEELEPLCRQAVLCGLHQDVAVQYVKRMMKSRMKSREQQVGGAQQMVDDAQKLSDFFSQQDCSESLWLGDVLRGLAEILQLEDPGSVQLEMVSVARRFPDLSDAHVLALLSVKTGLSAADVRSIRRSVEENRCPGDAVVQTPPFFSRVKVKWINNKMNQMGLKS